MLCPFDARSTKIVYSSAGIDQGGLLKDLLEEVIAAGLAPASGLLRRTSTLHHAYPTPAALSTPHGAANLQLLGLVVGKALHEGMLLGVELAAPFVLALQRRPAALEDLAALDDELYRSLLQARARRLHLSFCLPVRSLSGFAQLRWEAHGALHAKLPAQCRILLKVADQGCTA